MEQVPNQRLIMDELRDIRTSLQLICIALEDILKEMRWQKEIHLPTGTKRTKEAPCK